MGSPRVWPGVRGVMAGLAATCALWSAAPAWAVDEILLRAGGRLAGELQETQLSLRLPQGTYRVSRDTVWRILLSGGMTDAVELRNGNRLSGVLEQDRYTLRLASGEMRVVGRAEIDVIKLGAPTAAGGRLTDVLLLRSGDHVYGDVMGESFDLALASGTQRFARAQVWEIVLDAVAGDSLLLANGDRLSGVVPEGAYTIRTPDGQILRFARAEIGEVILRAAPGAGAGAGTPVGPGAGSAAGPAVGGGPSPGAAAGPPPSPAAPAPVPGSAAAPGGPYAGVVPSAALPAAIRSALHDLHFAFDRSDLTPEARATLEALATTMKDFSALGLLIEGHADERGTAEYNLALGARRAESARAYLVGLGIAEARIEVISYGKERPLDPGHAEPAWTLNRRAHFVVKSR